MTNNIDETGRHALTVNTAAWLVLPANERPYRPAAFRPAEKPAPTPRPAAVRVGFAEVDASATQVWPVSNAATVPVPTPRPSQPTGFITTVPAEPRDWRSRLWAMPWSARIAGIITLVSALVVAAVMAGVVS
jgi:hypothetical protein